MFEKDIEYRRNFESAEVKMYLKDFNYTKVKNNLVDSGYEFIYYKQIQKNKFLVFSTFFIKKTREEVYDCQIETYTSIKNIGNKKPINTEIICSGFKLKNKHLLDNYLNIQ